MTQPRIQLINKRIIAIPPNRQRREFDPSSIMELAQSILKNGLLHPIVIRDGYILVAGERRLRALDDVWFLGKLRCGGQEIDDQLVPCVDIGSLDPLEAEEAELEENIRRADLTWQEEAAATARLTDLRQRQAKAEGKPPPTVAAIAEEVRGSAAGANSETVRQQIIVAEHFDKPEVQGAKTLKDAFKALKRSETSDRNAALGNAYVESYKPDTHQCILVPDALEWMKEAQDEQFDVIITDPPYGVDADDFGDSAGMGGITGGHRYKDDRDFVLRMLSEFPAAAFKVCKPQAHLYLFCDIDWFQQYKIELTDEGWWVHRTPIIWHKPAGARIPWPRNGPQRKYEICLYAVKGKRDVNVVAPDLITINPDANLGHQAQKPTGLYGELLRRSVVPGNTVFDPFCGSGPVFPAAHALKCRAIGLDKDPACIGMSTGRIKTLV